MKNLTASHDPVKRLFIPGEEWLYMKVYCGYKSSDHILLNVICDVAENMIKENLIEKWFFIRYNDPDSHLRIRFKLKYDNYYARILNKLSESLGPSVANGLVWKIQLDTYLRELERYGLSNMCFTESLFFVDSKYVVKTLSFLNNYEDENIRWLCALKSIDKLLDDFSFTPMEKVEFYSGQKEAYSEEFNTDRSLRLQLSKKYRTQLDKISGVFKAPANDSVNTFADMLKMRSIEISELIDSQFSMIEGSGKMNRYLASIIHMHVNRFFRSKQRLHEYVLYDFLYRYSYSEIMRKTN